MARTEQLRSQTITVLKIILPLAALALMSTVFLLAKAPVTDGQIPYAEIEEIAREPRVSGAQISGVASDGSVIRIRADRAKPSGTIVEIEGLSAEVSTTEGVDIDLRAGTGTVDNTTQIARLNGLARIVTSNGYEMETTGLTADLESGRIESDGALEVRTPFGEMTAGQLVIETQRGDTVQTMLFQGGVRLVYRPQTQD